MKQLLLSIPTIIETETRVSWLTFKVVLIMVSFVAVGFFIFE
ncbi:hypothetical protein [Flavobacterium macacae]|nr:hypothetical protein [Flavobacterium macacae]